MTVKLDRATALLASLFYIQTWIPALRLKRWGESGLAAEKEFGKRKQKTPIWTGEIFCLLQQQVALVPPCLFGVFSITIYTVRHQSKIQVKWMNTFFLPSLLFPAQKQLDITNGKGSFVPKTGDTNTVSNHLFALSFAHKLPNWAFLLYLSHTPEVLSFGIKFYPSGTE